MTQNEFFKILGYLARPSRNTKLDVETHPRKRSSFEARYCQLTQVNPVPDNHNYYVWDTDANKWGSEMRIYFNGTNATIPCELANMAVSPRPGFSYDFRVNNNDFVWDLIEYGFQLGDLQNSRLIRGKVDPQYLVDFDGGYNIP